MKTYGGMDVQIHVFLTSTLVGGECSTSRPGRFTPLIHWIGGWVDPRAGLDDMEKWKFLTLPGLELNTSVVQPVASRYTDCAIPTLIKDKGYMSLENMKCIEGSILNWLGSITLEQDINGGWKYG
jgi:hypothetical protein